MSYTSYDFAESLDRAGITRASVAKVVAAWGDQGDCAEWQGGFLFESSDGRTGYLTGWCDTSGWGCQDGAQVYFYDDPVNDRTQLPGWYADDSKLGLVDWDEEPADLNSYLTEDRLS